MVKKYRQVALTPLVFMLAIAFSCGASELDGPSAFAGASDVSGSSYTFDYKASSGVVTNVFDDGKTTYLQLKMGESISDLYVQSPDGTKVPSTFDDRTSYTKISGVFSALEFNVGKDGANSAPVHILYTGIARASATLPVTAANFVPQPSEDGSSSAMSEGGGDAGAMSTQVPIPYAGQTAASNGDSSFAPQQQNASKSTSHSGPRMFGSIPFAAGAVGLGPLGRHAVHEMALAVKQRPLTVAIYFDQGATIAQSRDRACALRSEFAQYGVKNIKFISAGEAPNGIVQRMAVFVGGPASYSDHPGFAPLIARGPAGYHQSFETTLAEGRAATPAGDGESAQVNSDPSVAPAATFQTVVDPQPVPTQNVQPQSYQPQADASQTDQSTTTATMPRPAVVSNGVASMPLVVAAAVPSTPAAQTTTQSSPFDAVQVDRETAIAVQLAKLDSDLASKELMLQNMFVQDMLSADGFASAKQRLESKNASEKATLIAERDQLRANRLAAAQAAAAQAQAQAAALAEQQAMAQQVAAQQALAAQQAAAQQSLVQAPQAQPSSNFAQPAVMQATQYNQQQVLNIKGTPVWTITQDDHSLHDVIARWARAANLQLDWEVPQGDFDISGQARLNGTIDSAINTVLASLTSPETAIVARLYSNNVLRIAPKDQMQ